MRDSNRVMSPDTSLGLVFLCVTVKTQKITLIQFRTNHFIPIVSIHLRRSEFLSLSVMERQRRNIAAITTTLALVALIRYRPKFSLPTPFVDSVRSLTTDPAILPLTPYEWFVAAYTISFHNGSIHHVLPFVKADGSRTHPKIPSTFGGAGGIRTHEAVTDPPR